VGEWLGTGHPNAFETLVNAGSSNNPYCLQCHTLGWDAPVAYGDTTVTDHGLDHGGYDDVWGSTDPADIARAHALEGIQCESCHGSMGPSMYNHDPEVSLATRFENGESLAPCASCHGEQMEQWHEGAHGSWYERTGETVADYSAEWNRTACWTCHGAEGFIAAYDPDYAGMLPGATLDLVGCVACHDPHNDANPAQVRTQADQAVIYNAIFPATMTGQGTSQLCAQCHHARRDVANVESQVHGNGTTFGTLRGPHESPQMDMFLGTGSFEIPGFTYNRGSDVMGHKSIGNACVTCHMETSSPHGYPLHDHTFEATTQACQMCHPGLTDFNFNNGQTDIANLMGQIESYFGVPGDSLSSTTYTATITNPARREAIYGYLFVKNDGSHGVHNPSYATSLLTNALQHLQNN
jgi:hypothetical protein